MKFCVLSLVAMLFVSVAQADDIAPYQKEILEGIVGKVHQGMHVGGVIDFLDSTHDIDFNKLAQSDNRQRLRAIQELASAAEELRLQKHGLDSPLYARAYLLNAWERL